MDHNKNTMPSLVVENKQGDSAVAPKKNGGDLSSMMSKVMDQYTKRILSVIENWLPRKFTQDNVYAILGPQRYPVDLEALNKAIADPIWELLDRGSKFWRSVLLLLLGESLNNKSENLSDIVIMTEIIHNGSLVIDDIEDDSDFRRGRPCLHKIQKYGVDISINVANFMYFLPLQMIEKQRQKGHVSDEVLLKCYQVYSQEMVNLHMGQGLDICWHKNLGADKEPSVDEYLLMCANKTGGLARMSAKFSALLSGATQQQVEKIGQFAESIGIAFQIQDDLLNLDSSALSLGKGGVGEDIHEGKRSLMVIHCLGHSNEKDAKRLQYILSLKTNDAALIQEAIQLMRNTKSFEFARSKAQELVDSAWREVESFLHEGEAKQKLKGLANFLIARDK